jgi:hypothetical protein
MKQSKQLTTLAVAGAMLISLAGCGGDELPNLPAGDTTTRSSDVGETPTGTTTSDDPTDPVLNLSIEVVNNVVTNATDRLTGYFIDENCYVRSWTVPRRHSEQTYGLENATEFGEPIFDDARSIEKTDSGWFTGWENDTPQSTFFVLKNDNSLWAIGNNDSGILGDGTGVHRQEFVKILDNVANIYVPSSVRSALSDAQRTVYALTNDGTVYKWGGGTYAPELVLDDVAVFYSCGGVVYVIKKDGTLLSWRPGGGIEQLMGNVTQAVLVNSSMINAQQLHYVIRSDNSVWKIKTQPNQSIWSGFEVEQFLDDVKSIEVLLFQSNRNPAFMAIKTDNTLWGWGNNTNGELGDGTRINRDEPVLIADNVVSVSGRSYVDGDGNTWTWTADNPVPTMVD